MKFPAYLLSALLAGRIFWLGYVAVRVHLYAIGIPQLILPVWFLWLALKNFRSGK